MRDEDILAKRLVSGAVARSARRQMTIIAPELDLDPFSLEFLREPYPRHTLLREAGPVVRLVRYGIWGMGRHAEVSSALHIWQQICQ